MAPERKGKGLNRLIDNHPSFLELEIFSINYPRRVASHRISINKTSITVRTQTMKFTIPFILLFITACQSYTPLKSEWKTQNGTEVFYAAVSAKASQQAIESGSLAMRRSTCVNATNLLSTSPKLTSILLEQESIQLDEVEAKDLGRLISTHKIKPKQDSCQTESGNYFFASPAWESCQCVYIIEYPGGRKQFHQDINQVK